MTPTEIARQLGCNPATVFRALRATARQGRLAEGRRTAWSVR